MSTIYITKPSGDATRKTNTTGAALVVNQFLVLAGMCLKAREAIADAAIGCFEKLKGQVIQVADFVTSEGTFASANLAVYWDPSTGKFSNTKKATYYLIGYTEAAVASGVLEVEVIDPVLVPAFADLIDVDVAGVTNNDTLKYVASTGKWTDVAVAD